MNLTCYRRLMKGVAATCVALCLTVVVTNSFGAQLIVNGDFATGNFTGWSASNMSISQDNNGIRALSGDAYFAYTGKNGSLAQTINTVAGMSYTLSFIANNDLNNQLYNPTQCFISASQNGNLIFKNFSNLAIVNSWVQQSYTFTAIANNVTLQIAMNFQPANSQGYIDRISVVGASSVPGPSTYALVGLGALALIVVNRRRSKSATSSTQEASV